MSGSDHHSKEAIANLNEGHHHAANGRPEQAKEHLARARAHVSEHLREMRGTRSPADAALEAASWERLATQLEQRIADPSQSRYVYKSEGGGMAQAAPAQAAPTAPKSTVVSPMKPSGIHPDWKQSLTSVGGKASVNFHHSGTLGTVSMVPHENGGYDVKHAGASAGVKGVKGPFPSATAALQHLKSYIGAVSAGTTSAPHMHNFPSSSAHGLQRPTSYTSAPAAMLRGMPKSK